ncbi:histone RNA hairpin-binding protein [Plakobranchus ocellatus]|uniref:Histone RNA hairpin-binding protein n=1 Tax=Plakobranchus ocellatus TaxID=259542 RepID=A0AAV3Z1S0_9GAST|nr:histone RNA hairpin-binding protein [Plakobranchus ocellatus]
MEDIFQTSNDENQSTFSWADCVPEDLDQAEAEIEQVPSNEGFDLRHKISRSKSNSSTTGEEKPSATNLSPRKARYSGHDLRLKLSRNRQDREDHSSGGGRGSSNSSERGRRRREDRGRPRYTERVGGLSPLRSPRATTIQNILDLDNSRNHRFTNQASSASKKSPRTQPLRNTRIANHITPKNDVQSTDLLSPVLSDCDDVEERTPDYTRKSRRLDRASWTRRRLELPSESMVEEQGGVNRRLPPISEEDKVRLARREKDIAYGKNTDAYRKYIELVPRELRSENFKKHPRTPKKYKQCSRRSWDAQVKIWKRRIHAWANEEAENTEMDKSDSASNSSQPENSWASIVAHGRVAADRQSKDVDSNHDTDVDVDLDYDDEDDDIELKEAEGKEADPEVEEDEESFLDSVDIDFNVAHQVQEHVRLDDA